MAKKKKKKDCWDCRFFIPPACEPERRDVVPGRCHRHSPGASGSWPPVYGLDTCGDFKRLP